MLVRVEELNISGSLHRNVVKYHYFLRKKSNTNPRRGQIHERSPARITRRVIRGMMPHMTPRGAAALDRLKVFEGCPHPYGKIKKSCMPSALTNLRLKPNRKFCRLGDMAKTVGWKYNELIGKLEQKRKVAGAAYYNTKKELNKQKAAAVAAANEKLGATNEALAAMGY